MTDRKKVFFFFFNSGYSKISFKLPASLAITFWPVTPSSSAWWFERREKSLDGLQSLNTCEDLGLLPRLDQSQKQHFCFWSWLSVTKPA